MHQPLSDLTILDLSRVLAGPYCTMMLGDLGAEVIKIERPGGGDDTREWGPPFVDGESAYFLSVNRNKKSMVLDLKTEEGKEILRQLIAESDVLVENFRPGTMARLGFGYEEVKSLAPGLVYCSISGFGQDGPGASRPGYDLIIQAMGGMMSITGEPGGEPVRMGVALVDIGAGMFAAFSILAALREREESGLGQHIDISLLDTEVAWLSYMASHYFATGETPLKMGSAHPNVVPYQAFPAADEQHVVVAVGNDALWGRFCRALGRDELVEDPRFATNRDRVKNRSRLIDILTERFRQKPSDEWIEILQGAGVPCTPINDLEQVFADTQVKHREMRRKVEHPTAGEVSLTGIPMKFSRTPGCIREAPPLLGQHTEQVMKSLGYSPQEIENLHRQGVIDRRS